MAKQKKTNQIVIPPVPREAIADVRGEEDFVELLGESWCGPGLAPVSGGRAKTR